VAFQCGEKNMAFRSLLVVGSNATNPTIFTPENVQKARQSAIEAMSQPMRATGSEIDIDSLKVKSVPLLVQFKGTLDDFKNNEAARTWSINQHGKIFAQLQNRDADGKPVGNLAKTFIHKITISKMRSDLEPDCGIVISDGAGVIEGEVLTKDGHCFSAFALKGTDPSETVAFKREEKSINRTHMILLGLKSSEIKASIRYERPPGAESPVAAVTKNTDLAHSCLRRDNINNYMATQIAELASRGIGPENAVHPVTDPSVNSPYLLVDPLYAEVVKDFLLGAIEATKTNPDQYFTNLGSLEVQLKPLNSEWEFVTQDPVITSQMPAIRELMLQKYYNVSFHMTIEYTICDGPEWDALVNRSPASASTTH